MANSFLDLLRADRWDEDRILTQLRRARIVTTQRQPPQGKERTRSSRFDATTFSPTTCTRSAQGDACRGFPTGFERRDGGRGALPGPLTTERCWSHPSAGFPNRANQLSAWSPSPRIAIWSRSRTSSPSSSSSSAGRPRRSDRCIGTGAIRG